MKHCLMLLYMGSEFYYIEKRGAICCGINPQPLPPAFIARQPEIKVALAGANQTHTNAPG
ncbi:MAG: hypothetical protein ACYTXY_12325 [Nostoc sp.]